MSLSACSFLQFLAAAFRSRPNRRRLCGNRRVHERCDTCQVPGGFLARGAPEYYRPKVFSSGIVSAMFTSTNSTIWRVAWTFWAAVVRAPLSFAAHSPAAPFPENALLVVPGGFRTLLTPITDRASLQTAVTVWCSDLETSVATYGDISTWETSGVTDMSNLFNQYSSPVHCSTASTFNGAIGAWDVSAVTTMYRMFYAAQQFNAAIGAWSVGKVTDMSKMFASARQFNAAIGAWDVGAVTDMSYMFYSASQFNQSLCWSTSGKTNTNMFTSSSGSTNPSAAKCACVVGEYYTGTVCTICIGQTISYGKTESCIACSGEYPLSNADHTTCIAMTPAPTVSILPSPIPTSTPVPTLSFAPSPIPTAIPTPLPTASPSHAPITDTASLQTAVGAWCSNSAAASAMYGDISTWDTSGVTDMSNLFKFQYDYYYYYYYAQSMGSCSTASTFNEDIGAWDVSAVTTMSNMFYLASQFNGEIGAWDVSAVMDMAYMFYDASQFNGTVESWDVSAVTTMSNMFYLASQFNGAIGAWDVSAVTTMYSMLSSASQFNGAIEAWDVSAVMDMSSMFNAASQFNGAIGAWDVSAVTTMYFMLSFASQFNGAIEAWDVGAVTSMSYMFQSALQFNGVIGAWDVSAITTMSGMFRLASQFNGAIGAWDVGKVTNMWGMFGYALQFNQVLCWSTSGKTTTSMFTSSSGSTNPSAAKCACVAGEYYTGAACSSCIGDTISYGKTESCIACSGEYPFSNADHTTCIAVTPAPTVSILPSPIPTSTPTLSFAPSPIPSAIPTPLPTASPSHAPTLNPTSKPTHLPAPRPSHVPTPVPTTLVRVPTLTPTSKPPHLPTPRPSHVPTPVPTTLVRVAPLNVSSFTCGTDAVALRWTTQIDDACITMMFYLYTEAGKQVTNIDVYGWERGKTEYAYDWTPDSSSAYCPNEGLQPAAFYILLRCSSGGDHKTAVFNLSTQEHPLQPTAFPTTSNLTIARISEISGFYISTPKVITEIVHAKEIYLNGAALSLSSRQLRSVDDEPKDAVVELHREMMTLNQALNKNVEKLQATIDAQQATIDALKATIDAQQERRLT